MLCKDRPTAILRNLSKQFDLENLVIDWGDGKKTNYLDTIHVYDKDDVYTIKVKSFREAGGEVCLAEKVEPFYAMTLYIPNIITPAYEDGKNDEFIVQYGTTGRKASDFGFKVDLKIFNRWGKLLYANSDYQNTWRGDSQEAGVYYYHVSLNEGRDTCKGFIQLMK
jgi:gliding motility-associated-like protein